MCDHKIRIEKEYSDLKDKMTKLSDFVMSRKYSSLDKGEKLRIDRQFIYMTLYANVLEERLDA